MASPADGAPTVVVGQWEVPATRQEFLDLKAAPKEALHKNPTLTTDNTDNTDLHGSKKFN